MAKALQRTPLYDLHLELGAKMVPFSGYEMPVQYGTGILAEHRHARVGAVLFDVSHMGQAKMSGGDLALGFEALVPGDITGLDENRIRYTQLTNDAGGIIDDLMVTRRADHLFLVVNAARKEIDYRHIRSGLGDDLQLAPLETRALIALQGPMAANVLAGFCPEAAAMPFMTMIDAELGGAACLISRSGYTGEDGFEISVPADAADAVARLLLAGDAVQPSRPRRPGLAPPGGRALPLWPRYRRNHLTGGSRPRLVHTEAPARRGRFSGRRRYC
jgi:aminomethyltransferase